MEIEAGVNSLQIEGSVIQVGENDYDFVEQKPNVFNFDLVITPEYQSKLVGGKFAVKKIIFGNHGHPQAYLQSKVNKNKDFQKVAHMNFLKTKQLALATFYIASSNPDLLVIILNFSIEDEYEFKFSKFFFEYIDSKSLESVLVLETVYQEYIVTTEKKTPMKNPVLTKFTTSAHSNNSLFPTVPQIPVGNKQYGMTGDILTHLEMNGLRGEVVVLTPVEMELCFTDIQAFEVLRQIYPQLNVDTTNADSRQILQRLNDTLYSSGMFM